MSHQCSCGRDLNNNYVSYTSAYANGSSSLDRDTNSSLSGGGVGGGSKSAMSGKTTQLTAKVMFGTVGAIKDLREKEKSRHAITRASDRRN
ncbi:PREDICTED: uncharacterized protein LOC108356464 [Rhagoletis zephyria]|uniref:uncharacterized protein LOC108356464 n=1 Tax=Rhagoletis zephyria TaxID=28612 RepID=UPI00081151C9|nr:PREDICTED: uncharacterized protein LOC108356464 [Rhagoletis zephyria]XP_036323379.1 uncharacterized protein LOC118737157 [Rhagoletis pomonella]